MTTPRVHLAVGNPVRDLLFRIVLLALAALAIFVGLPFLADHAG